MERITRKIINPALMIAGKIVPQMDHTASKMGAGGTSRGGMCSSTGGIGAFAGGNLNAKCVFTGGSATRADTHITAYGTQMCVRMRDLAAEIVQKFCHIATLRCGSRGIRDLPDKCVCDTNAYLARNYKSHLHLYGCHMILRQEGCTYFSSGRWDTCQRGFAYE